MVANWANLACSGMICICVCLVSDVCVSKHHCHWGIHCVSCKLVSVSNAMRSGTTMWLVLTSCLITPLIKSVKIKSVGISCLKARTELMSVGIGLQFAIFIYNLLFFAFSLTW